MEVFIDGEQALEQFVGIQIQGHSSRYEEPQKRYSIIAREAYSGSSVFDVPLIDGQNQHQWLIRQEEMYAICQSLTDDLSAKNIDLIPVYVFLDGEFWYKAFLYEKFSETNTAYEYNLPKEEVVIEKNGEGAENMNEGENPFDEMRYFVSNHDMADSDNYTAFSKKLDIQSYIEMACYNQYMANLDGHEFYNNCYWHTINPVNEEWGDSRWRCGFYDMDLDWPSLASTFGSIPAYLVDRTYMYDKFHYDCMDKWTIYSALRANETFRQQYCLTFMDLVNTRFDTEYVLSVIDSLGIQNEEYETFFKERAKYVIPFVAAEYELSGNLSSVTLVSNKEDKQVQLNTCFPQLNPDEDGKYSWSGSYFAEYPVTVTVEDPAFSHWEIMSNGKCDIYDEPTLQISVLEGDVIVNAIFK